MKIDTKSFERMLREQARRLTLDVPPIPFEVKVSDSDAKKDADDDGETEVRMFTLKIGEEKHSTVEKWVRVFYDGSPKDRVKFRIDLEDLEKEAPLKKCDQKCKTIDALLKGKCWTQFCTAVHNRISLIDERDKTDDELEKLKWKTLELALNEVAKSVFVMSNPLRRQKYYIRHYVFKEDHVSVRDFTRTLSEYNQYFKYFPYSESRNKRPKPLPDDELADILNRAKPVRWHLDMLGANIDPYAQSYANFVDYLEWLEVKDSIAGASKKQTASDKSDETTDSDVEDQKHRKTSQNNKWNNANNKGSGKKNKCKLCGKRGHKEKDCWELDANASQRPDNWKPTKDKKVGSTSVTQEQINTMIQAALKTVQKPKKRRVIHEEDSDDEVYDSNFMQVSDNLKSDTSYDTSYD